MSAQLCKHVKIALGVFFLQLSIDGALALTEKIQLEEVKIQDGRILTGVCAEDTTTQASSLKAFKKLKGYCSSAPSDETLCQSNRFVKYSKPDEASVNTQKTSCWLFDTEAQARR